MADGQAVGRALRGAPPHAGAPGGAVLPVLGLQQLGARGPRGAHVQVAQREVAGLQVQADAVVEGEPPGGPQQLLVLQPHAVVELEVMGCYESVPTQTPQNSPQSMRVWPGLRLIGAGGKTPKGVFVAVAEVEPDGVRLEEHLLLL